MFTPALKFYNATLKFPLCDIVFSTRRSRFTFSFQCLKSDMWTCSFRARRASLPTRMNGFSSTESPLYSCGRKTIWRRGGSTVNGVITALENTTDPLEIDGLVLRIDYLIRTLVNVENHPQTDEIIRLFGEASNKLTREAQSDLVLLVSWFQKVFIPPWLVAFWFEPPIRLEKQFSFGCILELCV